MRGIVHDGNRSRVDAALLTTIALEEPLHFGFAFAFHETREGYNRLTLHPAETPRTKLEQLPNEGDQDVDAFVESLG